MSKSFRQLSRVLSPGRKWVLRLCDQFTLRGRPAFPSLAQSLPQAASALLGNCGQKYPPLQAPPSRSGWSAGTATRASLEKAGPGLPDSPLDATSLSRTPGEAGPRSQPGTGGASGGCRTHSRRRLACPAFPRLFPLSLKAHPQLAGLAWA